GRGARMVPVVGSALVLVSALMTARRFGDEPRSLALVGEETSGARPLLHLVRRLADRDGDGFSSILGGGGCNDRHAQIPPGADDKPGNGVDEDCSGEDAVAQVARPAEKPAHSAAAGRYKFDGNLVVITIDTLRADRVNDRVMPHLNAFARSATWFQNAYAQA